MIGAVLNALYGYKKRGGLPPHGNETGCPASGKKFPEFCANLIEDPRRRNDR
jgi:hypothetical protein